MDHPMFPEGLIQLNTCKDVVSDEKRRNIRAIYPMEG